jgi:energy-coupling factor transporter ATP-binding protein EcfA2
MPIQKLPMLVITGPVGVGKTTVAAALSELLSQADLAHALIDLDWLRWCYPSPADDPFQLTLGIQNLAAVWSHEQAAGAARLILVDVVETRATLDSYQAAIPHAERLLVRLHADLATLRQRLEGREVGASLAWHQQRAAELTTLMERARLEDLLVDTMDRSALDIAGEIIARTGWIAR